jgi:hypothetical protein
MIKQVCVALKCSQPVNNSTYLSKMNNRKEEDIKGKGKGKAIPLQAWTGP